MSEKRTPRQIANEIVGSLLKNGLCKHELAIEIENAIEAEREDAEKWKQPYISSLDTLKKIVSDLSSENERMRAILKESGFE
jgi:hypothetical protein